MAEDYWVQRRTVRPLRNQAGSTSRRPFGRAPRHRLATASLYVAGGDRTCQPSSFRRGERFAGARLPTPGSGRRCAFTSLFRRRKEVTTPFHALRDHSALRVRRPCARVWFRFARQRLYRGLQSLSIRHSCAHPRRWRGVGGTTRARGRGRARQSRWG